METIIILILDLPDLKSIMKFSSSNMHLKVCLQNLLPNTPSKVCLKL